MLCDLLFGILGMIILTLLVYYKQNIFKDFIKTLNKEQKTILNSIFRERIWITIFGVIIAVLVTFGLTYVISEKSWINKICLMTISIVFFTSIVYLLFPKSDHLILHLNSSQMRDWIHIQDYIKFIAVLGFIIGIMFYFLFSKLFKKIF